MPVDLNWMREHCTKDHSQEALREPFSVVLGGSGWSGVTDGHFAFVVKGDGGFAPRPDWAGVFAEALSASVTIDLPALKAWAKDTPGPTPCTTCTAKGRVPCGRCQENRETDGCEKRCPDCMEGQRQPRDIDCYGWLSKGSLDRRLLARALAPFTDGECFTSSPWLTPTDDKPFCFRGSDWVAMVMPVRGVDPKTPAFREEDRPDPSAPPPPPKKPEPKLEPAELRGKVTGASRGHYLEIACPVEAVTIGTEVIIRRADAEANHAK